MNNLLLEIGTEEIPASYIEPALKALSSLLLQKLTEARIEHGDAGTFGTPRRLAVKIANVANRQKPLATEVTGPPQRVGFDEYGNPTVAAEKFAEKVGVSVSSLEIKETKKGLYLCAKKTEQGLAAKTLLESILPEAIVKIPFPKSMRWADLNLEFARPIHSILALSGKDIIPFALGNIKSGRYTFGHRFMHPDKIKIDVPDDYIEALHSAYVLVDLEERKKNIKEKISKAAKSLGGRVLPDNELVDIVTNLVEYPEVAAGKFDTKFLDLPDEVLITSMREHQKYFAVIDDKNNIMPCFIVVNNTPAKDMSLVAKGHERVLRARLEDAQFFYKSDLKISFAGWIEKLKGVLFQAGLGSMDEKVMRVCKIAEFLADAAECDSNLKKHILRAAWLCKADLVSHVVVEFPKLQGVMGKVYALLAGESDIVASAIEEHYKPNYSGGPLPETIAGALLGISDKIDSICGCFSTGLIPTGASDPYALRRQGIGIVQIMLEKGFSFSLSRMIDKSLELFGKDQKNKETAGKVYNFLKDRISHLLIEEGFSKDVISSIVSISVDHVPDVFSKVRALEKLKSEPDFEPLAIAFKRVVNIIKKADRFETKDVDESLFQDECESLLFASCKEVEKKMHNDLDKGFFDRALLDMATLRDSIDAFFDGVMVMAEDADVRCNRLMLLKYIADLFETFADFSKISTGSAS